MSSVRKAVAWQICGGIVATLAIFASVGELLWWSLYLSDRTNVTPAWTWIVHSSAVLAIAAVTIYHAQRERRRVALLAGGPAAGLEDRGVTFRIGAFPIRIQWMFFVLAALIGYRAENLDRTAAFIALATIAILVHELGHAIAAARFGASDIEIVLHGLGGLTTFTSESLRPRQRAIIALAGPATGIAIGCVLLLVALLVPSLRGSNLVRDTLLVTLGWAIANLVPAWPLDGAALLAALLKSEWLPNAVSLAVATTGAAASIVLRRMDFLAFFAVLTILNVFTIPGVRRTVARWNARIG